MNLNNKMIDNFIEFKSEVNYSQNENIDPDTLSTYERILKNFSKSIENKNFKNIERKDIIRFLKGYKQRYKNLIITTLKDFYRYILDLDKNEKLPKYFKDIKSRKVKIDHVKYREKVVTEEEYELLQNYCTNPFHKALIELLSITGCREGESVSINSKDINYDGTFTRITIRESKTTTRINTILDRPKYLMNWVEELQPYKNSKKEDNKPLFATKNKEKPKRILPNYPYKIITRLCIKIKKDYPNFKIITPHDFRHTRITNMRKKGVPDSFIEKELGLIKGSTQIATYDHTNNKDYEEYLKNKINETKPTYELLEKQKKTIEEKHEKEIKKHDKQIDGLNKKVEYMFNIIKENEKEWIDDDKWFWKERKAIDEETGEKFLIVLDKEKGGYVIKEYDEKRERLVYNKDGKVIGKIKTKKD